MSDARSRFRRATALALLVAAGLATACQPGAVGAPCAAGAGHDGTNLLACRDGRWVAVMTLRELADRVAAARGDAPPPLPAVPISSWRLDGEVLAIAVMGDVVYLGGDFRTATSPDGRTTRAADRLIAVDGRTGAPIDGFRAGTDGTVRALFAVGDRLFVGGSFTHLNGAARAHVAELDRTTGAVGPWAPGADDDVRALVRSGDRVYLGGDFTTVGGAPRRHLAAVRLDSGAADPGFAPRPNAGVTSIATSVDGGRIFVGGPFGSIDGVATTGVAELRPDGSVARARFDGADGPALDLEATADGGLLAAIGGEADRALSFDATGQRRWTLQCDGDMQAVHLAGHAYGGFHRSCGGNTAVRLLRADPVSGAVDVGWAPRFDRFWGVRDIAGGPTFLVVAGDMTSVGGVAVGGFAIFRS